MSLLQIKYQPISLLHGVAALIHLALKLPWLKMSLQTPGVSFFNAF